MPRKLTDKDHLVLTERGKALCDTPRVYHLPTADELFGEEETKVEPKGPSADDLWQSVLFYLPRVIAAGVHPTDCEIDPCEACENRDDLVTDMRKLADHIENGGDLPSSY